MQQRTERAGAKAQNPQVSPPVEEKKQKRNTRAEARAELSQAIKGSKDVILEITTPFSLSPTTLRLDRSNVSVVGTKMTSSSGEINYPIEYILNIEAKSGMLTGHVKIDVDGMIRDEPYEVGPFWKKDAKKMAHTVQGYIIALQRQIDTGSLSPSELQEMLEKLGEP